ncbi:MAG: ferritin-like domain-containing protein [Candidatus Heimdallarchaeaceae archaeon]
MTIQVTEEYLDLLNQAVSRELQVSIQYFLQHSKMEKIARKVRPENILLEKTTYDTFGEILKEFAIEEMKHAGDIMERIFILGGEATTKSDSPKIGNSISEFAKLGLEAEEEALVLYRKIIVMAGQLGDRETRQMFNKIYSDEEKHSLRFQEFVDFDDSELEIEQPFEAEWIKTLTPEYFELLNKALASEISAIIQYTVQHEKASMLALRKKVTPLEMITGSNIAEVVSELLKKVFMQEMDHFEKIAERIYLLDGECVYNPDPLPQVGENVIEFLKLNHKAEDEAIVFYRKIIEEATKIGDITTKQLFEEILMEEEEHYWMFDDFF